MKQSIKFKITALLVVPLGLACFALLPRVQAVTPDVSPAPDGAYPYGNTAEWNGALFSLSNGIWNMAIGQQTLYKDTSGDGNTAVGFGVLYSNTTGNSNTATGIIGS